MATTMSKWQADGSSRPRGASSAQTYSGTVLSIIALLACWFVIGHWSELPQIIDSTMAALP